MGKSNKGQKNAETSRKLSHEELKAMRKKAGIEQPRPTSNTTYGSRQSQVFCVLRFQPRPDERVRMLQEGKFVVGTVGQRIPGYVEVPHSRTAHLGRAQQMVKNLLEGRGLGGFVQARAGEVRESLAKLRQESKLRYQRAQRIAREALSWEKYEGMIQMVREVTT